MNHPKTKGIVTFYSQDNNNTSRFLIILNHTKKENGKIVFNRIAKVYEELGGNRRDIDYQITPMYQE